MSTTRPSKVFLTSRFRQPGESNVNFTNYFQNTIVGCKEVDLDKICLPNLVYFFKSTNSTLVIRQSSTDYTISIPTNRTWTDGGAFSTSLNALFTAAGLTNLTSSYDSDTNKLTLTDSTTAFTIESSSTCLRKLGFLNTTSNSTSALSHEGSSNLILNGSTVIYVRSDIVAGDTTTPFGGVDESPEGADIFDILSMIPVNFTYGDIISYQSTVDKIFVNPTSSRIQSMTIRLLDEDYEYLNLAEGAEVQLEFSLQY